MSNTATAKQIEFIKSLKAQREWIDLTDIAISTDESRALAESHPAAFEAGFALKIGQDLWRADSFDTKAASVVIDFLKKAPKKAESRIEEPSQAPAPADAPEGMHKFGGVIFKVQVAVHGSGKRYAKALVEDGNGGWAFEYAPGAIKNLSESTRLSLEEAKQFGVLYGTCCVCGRTLTDENSIKAGIGPVCSGKF